MPGASVVAWSISVHASSPCIHPSIHPPIHPAAHAPAVAHSQWGTEPASCLRAHLGTVHGCSRRRGLARNRSWASRAFANRLAGKWKEEWREKKNALRRNVERQRKTGLIAVWGEETFWEAKMWDKVSQWKLSEAFGSHPVELWVINTAHKYALYWGHCRLQLSITAHVRF